MAENQGMDVEKVKLLRDRGWTCAKLKARENKERKEKLVSFKDAQDYRAGGFQTAGEKKEVIGKAQEGLAETISVLRKQVCGLK